MYFRNSVTIGLWFTVLFSANITAKETVIYRWLDSNNVVHYSQHQPKSGEYTQLTTVSSFQTNEKKPIKSNDTPDNDVLTIDDQISQYEKDKAEILAKNAEIAKKNCKAAQLNQQMLNSFDEVMMTGADGKDTVMSDKEKKEQLALNKKHISLYCSKSSLIKQ